MINEITSRRLASIALAAAAIIVTNGHFSDAAAQRDPFAKPAFMRPKKTPAPGAKVGGSKEPAVPVNYGPPSVEARIEYFKRVREQALANGGPLPKPTSVMTLSELAVTGIFKTPRGYAAMVEATPIKLSYTIYPGEKFFDGQLVAVEENQLVFRRVTKVGEGKFIASVENKPLRKYSTRAQIEGTAPAGASDKPVETARVETPQQQPPPAAKGARPPSNPFLSPVDEMNSMPEKPQTEDKRRNAPKKPVKVAANKRGQ